MVVKIHTFNDTERDGIGSSMYTFICTCSPRPLDLLKLMSIEVLKSNDCELCDDELA